MKKTISRVAIAALFVGAAFCLSVVRVPERAHLLASERGATSVARTAESSALPSSAVESPSQIEHASSWIVGWSPASPGIDVRHEPCSFVPDDPNVAPPIPNDDVRATSVRATAPLPVEVIRRIVRLNHGRFRECYLRGRAGNPDLEGRVAIRFTMGRRGTVSKVCSGGSDLPDGEVVSCIKRVSSKLLFPAPSDGEVSVAYTLEFLLPS